jgi:alpha-beta hydrolase superfamily lysophospholipase
MLPRVGLRWVRRAAVAFLVLGGLYVGSALGLTAWPLPGFSTPVDTSPETLRAAGLIFAQEYDFEPRRFRAPDGSRLFARYFPVAEPATTVLLVHGMGGDSRPYNRTAGRLREALAADVYALDLRGHGRSDGRAGDVDAVGQYEEDLAAVISAIRAERPGARLVLAAHSMGGGIAARYAMRPAEPAVDAYVLYAPELGRDAPTIRSDPPPPGVEPWLKLDLPRLLGLVMLNTIGVTALDGLPIVALHTTEEDRVRAYSFRALASAGPDSHAEALAAFAAPLLVVVGSEDEAYRADRYAAAVAEHARAPARVEVIEGASHNGVLHDPRAVAAVAAWLSSPD